MSQVSVNSDPVAPALPSLGDLEGDDLVEASVLLADENNAGLGAYNAPIAITENSSQIWGHLPTIADRRYSRYAREGRRFVMGPMPPRDFLDTFCNCPDEVMKDMPSTDDAFAQVPSSAGAERAIYEPLINALNLVQNDVSRCPGYQFRDTSQDPDSKGSATFKPDIICYSNKHLKHVVVDKPSPSALRSRTDMGFAAFFFEVKKAPKNDFFQDPPPGSSRGYDLQKKKKIEEEYGQNISYATEVFARQHRCHCFSVSMSGSHARLMLWDRAGAIATRSFDIKKEPEILCEFVWRFAHMSEAQRGLDMTVKPASPAEEAVFRRSLKVHVMQQLPDLDEVLLEARIYEHYQREAVSTIYMFSADPVDPTITVAFKLLISRPLISPLSPTGRSTRIYWGVRQDTREVVFLKDTWRLDGEGAEEEGDVLQSLAEAGVRNVPGVIFHGHIPALGEWAESGASAPMNHPGYQSTRTHDFAQEDWVCDVGIDLTLLVKHTHYRLVLPVAGYPLSQLSGTSELVAAGYDAYLALLDAQSKKKRLHRDVSVGSILLFRKAGDEKRTGYLVDWDLSWVIDSQDPLVAIGQPRDATWQFMSISVLRNRSVRHTPQDDLESVLYVLWYCALRWLPHDVDDAELRSILNKYFDLFIDSRGKPSNKKLRLQGGSGKMMNATDRGLTEKVEFENEDLHWFLNRWLDFHEAHFKRVATSPTTSDSPAAAIQVEWTRPATIAEFWKCFLASHELPSDDRVIRALSNESRTLKENDRHPATVPSSGSTHPETWKPGTGLWAALPSMQDPEDPDAPPKKKRRVASDEPSDEFAKLLEEYSW